MSGNADNIDTQPYGHDDEVHKTDIDDEYVTDDQMLLLDDTDVMMDVDEGQMRTYEPLAMTEDGNDDESVNGEDELMQSVEVEVEDVPEGNTRFALFDNEELDFFIDGQKNTETKRKTESHIRLLKSFLEMRGEVRELYLIPPPVLDDLLALFFVSVRKESGNEEYEPCTLKGMQSSFERHLKEHSYSHSVIASAEFFKSREAIRSKCRQLKKKGKGNKPNKKRAPTQEEISKMWESGALGSGTPETLQHTMWWIVNTRFGKRVNKENEVMKWGIFC